MENISLKLKFELENGSKYDVTIRDVRSDITDIEISALANSIIQKGAEYKGSKFKNLVSCDKTTSLTERLI